MDKVFTEEKSHVEKLKNSVKNALSEVEQILKKVGITNLDRLKELKTEGEFGPDFLMFLEQLHEKNAALNFGFSIFLECFFSKNSCSGSLARRGSVLKLVYREKNKGRWRTDASSFTKYF